MFKAHRLKLKVLFFFWKLQRHRLTLNEVHVGSFAGMLVLKFQRVG